MTQAEECILISHWVKNPTVIEFIFPEKRRKVMNVSLKLLPIINVYPCLNKYMFSALYLSKPANNYVKLSLIPHKWLKSPTEALSHII